ncbi:DNA polymerase III subunit psi [Vibrio rumoiensis]|uniref:DNA polymerase III subunit psi n=1 Tax=Vibrio rumoiensis 1S-45 TaxID=1188252 RepID=A0A1E5E2R9_9VIBR|nr:DNA polymerase III subunit psi [Vibrio rumoiensis]OEF25848.1 DNA polymerase III subunit psi [Vibrio rumoiensis 1S-45]
MLNLREQQYLQEMAIPVWELAHPERLQGYQAPGLVLPSSCVLLLVSESLPQGEDATLFIKVLGSMTLKPEQALQITPAQLVTLEKHQLSWIWFAGCEVSLTLDGVNQLSSPLLQDIHGNTQNRRDLWQQICSYDTK